MIKAGLSQVGIAQLTLLVLWLILNGQSHGAPDWYQSAESLWILGMPQENQWAIPNGAAESMISLENLTFEG